VEMMQHCAIFCNGKNAEAGANKNGAGSGIQGYGKGGSLKLRAPPSPMIGALFPCERCNHQALMVIAPTGIILETYGVFM